MGVCGVPRACHFEYYVPEGLAKHGIEAGKNDVMVLGEYVQTVFIAKVFQLLRYRRNCRSDVDQKAIVTSSSRNKACIYIPLEALKDVYKT